MKRAVLLTSVALASSLSALSVTGVDAAPALRVQLTQKGDFALLGNTLGHDCGSGVAPIVGEVGACGPQVGDSAPDVYWRADDPGDGEALASLAIAPEDARSTAVLELPPQAVVSRAYLHWSAIGPTADNLVTLEGPSGSPVELAADATYLASVDAYVAHASVVDVTALVTAQGAGPYQISGVEIPDFRATNQQVTFGAWWMVVLYEDPAGDLRNLAVFDGLDGVSEDAAQEVSLAGFTVPGAGFTGKLGVVALEGDQQATGDQLVFEGEPLTDDGNPIDNFFNGSRTVLGEATHLAGDLPELSGAPGSMSGIDLDVVDVTPLLFPGQTSATIGAQSDGDVFWLSTFVTSIATFAPDFVHTVKTVTDLDGAPARPGDLLEFAIEVANSGNDDAQGVTLTDVLVPGLVFVPSSLTVDGVPATDASGDDVFDYDAPSATLVVRLGVGATAAVGGVLAEGATSTVRFRVQIDADASGALTNQARVDAIGALGGSAGTWLSGSPDGPGTTTAVTVDECSPGECGGGGGGAGGAGAGGSGGAGGHTSSSTGGSGGQGGAGGQGDGGASTPTTSGTGAGETSAAGTGGTGASDVVGNVASSGAGDPSSVNEAVLRGDGLTCAAHSARGSDGRDVGWASALLGAVGVALARRRARSRL